MFFKRFLCLSRVAGLALAAMSLAGCAGGPSLDEIAGAAGTVINQGGGPLSSNEITAGLKEALSVSSNAVVRQVGLKDGFNADPQIRVPLPRALVRARDYASKVGMQGSFDDLETRLNRAAEKAAPKARTLFVNAIKQMTVNDAQGILRGPDNAATQYFEDKTGTRLQAAMKPLIDQSLSEVGAVNSFNQLLTAYRSIPLAPKLEADLSRHVVQKATDGIFHYIAKEEKAIRQNPLKRTSQLLQRVFGAQ